MKYKVLQVKHAFASYSWHEAEEVEAEGPCQAAEAWVLDEMSARGYTNESGCVRVLAVDTQEAFCFDFNFKSRPVVGLRWRR